MFNRTRNPRDAAATIDDILADLQAPAHPPVPTTPSGPTAAPATPPGTGPVPQAPAPLQPVDHAATLRATRDAQQQAQEMLAMASHTRTAASEQAEQIVVEAHTAAERMRADAARDAERTRREAADWVSTQRTRVDALIAEATEAVDAEVEDIRAEALRSAMAEAEQTARLYVGEAASRGARDAEAIRGNAREVLDRARVLATDLQGAVRELAEALARTTGAAEQKLAAIDELLAQVQLSESAHAPTPLPAVVVPETRTDDPLDPAVGWEDDAAPTAPSGTERPAGRELGAMFRGNATGA